MTLTPREYISPRAALKVITLLLRFTELLSRAVKIIQQKCLTKVKTIHLTLTTCLTT